MLHRIYLSFSLSNSFPLSFCSSLTVIPEVLASAIVSTNFELTSDFSFMKYTRRYLEKLSLNSTKYLYPLNDGISKGSHHMN